MRILLLLCLAGVTVALPVGPYIPGAYRPPAPAYTPAPYNPAYIDANFPNETPLKSLWNPLEISLNLYKSIISIILMILEVNKR